MSRLYTEQRLSGAGVFAGMGDVGGGGATLVTAANSAQANTCTAGAIRQTHLVGAAASVQGNAASAGSVTQDTTSFIGAAHSVQANACSAGAVRQTHLIGGANSQVANRASSAAAGEPVAVVLGRRSRLFVQMASRPRQIQ